jgi:predicted Zn-dependent peptidase
MYKKSIFPNGVRIVTESMQNIHSACIGILIAVGSRNEQPEHNGFSHFVEHMRFKGTTYRSVRELAEIIDELGGHVDASTGREYTYYYAKVIDSKLSHAMNILCEIFFESIFAPEEIEREKQVIKEEIQMYEDTPDELIYDIFMQTIWKGHPLGQPIWGRKEIIDNVTQERLLQFCKRYYTPDRIIISAAGNILHEQIVELSMPFSNMKSNEIKPTERIPPKQHSGITVVEKDLSQVHICIGTKGLPHAHQDRFALRLLSIIIGGGISSRLFQIIREKKALAYDIHSYCVSYHDTGVFAIYVGTSPQNYQHCIELITKELSKLKKPNDISSQELEKAKERMKATLILHMEDSSYRMSRLAEQELFLNRYYPIEEIMKLIDNVSKEDILRIASSLFNTVSIASIGPISKDEYQKLGLRID